MEKIYITEDTFFYKTKIDDYNKSKLVQELKYNIDINRNTKVSSKKSPGTQSQIVLMGGEVGNTLSKVVDILDTHIYKSTNTYSINNWVYLSSNKNPYAGFHEHTTMLDVRTKGEWTWTFYVQMPDNLKGGDGELIFSINDIEKSFLPIEGDLFIFPADILHKPNTNLSSTKDRVVLAGTVCKMDLDKEFIKRKNTLI